MKTTKMLLQEGLKRLIPLKHVEFICPACGGIATVHRSGDTIIVECHACSRKAREWA